MKPDLGCKDCDKRVPGCHSTCVSYFAHKLAHVEKGYEKLDLLKDSDFKDRYFGTTCNSKRGKQRAHIINSNKRRKRG